MLDRLEQKARFVAPAQPHERRHRSGQVGHELSPYGDDAELGGESDEPVAVELLERDGVAVSHESPHAPWWDDEPSKDRKKQVRAPVWQAPLPCCSTRNSSVSPSQS